MISIQVSFFSILLGTCGCRIQLSLHSVQSLALRPPESTVCTLFEKLHVHSCDLQEINIRLRGNQSSTFLARALAKLITKSANTLTECQLDLRNNFTLCDLGMTLILQALMACPHLKVLGVDIRGNRGSAFIGSFISHVMQCSSISDFVLSGDGGTYKGEMRVARGFDCVVKLLPRGNLCRTVYPIVNMAQRATSCLHRSACTMARRPVINIGFDRIDAAPWQQRTTPYGNSGAGDAAIPGERAPPMPQHSRHV